MTGTDKEVSTIGAENFTEGQTITFSHHESPYTEYEISKLIHSRNAEITEGGKYPSLENPISNKFVLKKTGQKITGEDLAIRMGWNQ
jgi:hypothetical protein